MVAPSSPRPPIYSYAHPTCSCTHAWTHPASGAAPLVALLLHRASPTLLLLAGDVDVVGVETGEVEVAVCPASLALLSSECGRCCCGHRRLKLADKNRIAKWLTRRRPPHRNGHTALSSLRRTGHSVMRTVRESRPQRPLLQHRAPETGQSVCAFVYELDEMGVAVHC